MTDGRPDVGPEARPRSLVGVSLKAYLGYERTLAWCRAVVTIVRQHPATVHGHVGFVVLPAAPLLEPVLRICEGSPVMVGAQDVSRYGFGPYTGEVTASLLAQMGCQFALIGHAERRRLLGETDELIAEKAAMTSRHGLRPIICVGEEMPPSDPSEASAHVVAQLDAATASIDRGRPVVVAYEPAWAIGGHQPAPVKQIRVVCKALRDRLRASGSLESVVIYGGSAQAGLWTEIGEAVDGIFLGRSAHDPGAVRQVLDEVRPRGATSGPR